MPQLLGLETDALLGRLSHGLGKPRRRLVGQDALERGHPVPGAASAGVLDGVDVRLDHLGGGRAPDGGDVEDLAVADQARPVGVLVLGAGIVYGAGVDEAQLGGRDLVDQESAGAAEVAVQVLAPIGGAGHPDGPRHVALCVDIQWGRRVELRDALALEDGQGGLQGIGVDVAELPVRRGLQVLDLEPGELLGGWRQTHRIGQDADQPGRRGVRQGPGGEADAQGDLV